MASSLELLGSVPVFSGLKDKHRRAFLKEGTEMSFKAGDAIVKQGDKGIAFYLILDGEAEVRSDGKVVDTLSRGDYFGDMALIDREPRSADVIAIEPTKCFVMSDWDFQGFVKTHPDVIWNLLQVQTKRLRASMKRSMVS